MHMNSFKTKVQELFGEEPEPESNELLKTIRVPKNLLYLSNRLPNANYGGDRHISNSFK